MTAPALPAAASASAPASAFPSPPPALELSGVTKRFGGLTVLDRLDLSLDRGAMLCILGPNGCGKTTLFNLVTGALEPDEGTIRVDGASVGGLSPFEISRRGIGRKFQVPGIYPELSVAENLEVPLMAGGAGRAGRAGNGPLALLRRIGSGKATRARRDELLELSGLGAKAEAPVSAISHGERQRLEIAMLLARGSDTLLLDEPTAGMSVTETQGVCDLVTRLQRVHGRSVLLIEHDMGFVRALGCPIVVMVRGKVIARGSYDEVSRDPAVIQSYLGRAR